MIATLFRTILLFGALTQLSCAQEPFSIEATSRADINSLPPALQEILQEPGTRLLTPLNGLNTTVAEVWWRKEIPVQKSSSRQDDVIYGDLKEGTLLGVLRFPPETSDRFREDVRDQKLRPGFYTMRYALIPNDRTHKDASRYRDAVILSRVSVDTDYTKVLSTDEMLNQSRLASRTRHPAVLSLVPVRSVYKDFPKAITDTSGLCTLQTKVHAKAANSEPSEIPLAVILVTPEVDEGGS